MWVNGIVVYWQITDENGKVLEKYKGTFTMKSYMEINEKNLMNAVKESAWMYTEEQKKNISIISWEPSFSVYAYTAKRRKKNEDEEI